MTTFDQRERAFETQFAHDEEMRFKITARRNRAVAAWACGLLGKDGVVAAAYGDDVVASAVAGADDAALANRIADDLARSGHAMTAGDVKAEMDRQWAIAVAQERGA